MPLHPFMSAVQLAGEVAPCAVKIALVSAILSVAQLGNPLTVWSSAAVSSLMQAEYWATVAVHGEGIELQLAVVPASA